MYILLNMLFNPRYFAHLCKEKAEKNNGVLKIHKVRDCLQLYHFKFTFVQHFRIKLLLKIHWKESLMK